jgi:hypothetical protein
VQRFIEYQDSDEFALCENDSYYGTLICWPCSRGILGLEFRPTEKERGKRSAVRDPADSLLARGLAPFPSNPTLESVPTL